MCNVKQKRSITTGTVFNELTALEYVGIIDRRKNFQFLCSCGAYLILPGNKVKDGSYKRCKDCSFRLRSQRHTPVPQINQVFNRLVVLRAKKAGIPLEITVDDFEKIASQICFYCKRTPKEVNQFKIRKHINTTPIFLNGIDRVDNTKGYTLDNSISCCTRCNYAKHTQTQEEFFEMIISIYNNLKLEERNKNER